MNDTDLFHEDIPSNRIDLLATLLGRRIRRLTRYSLEAPDLVVRDYGLESGEIFGKTGGPVVVEVIGRTFGFGSQDSMASVTVWLEARRGAPPKADAIANDPELFPIQADDPIYSVAAFAEMVGQRIVELSVYRRDPESVLHTYLPREVAVCLRLESGAALLLSHGLAAGADNFLVLLPADIAPDIWKSLKEIVRLEW